MDTIRLQFPTADYAEEIWNFRQEILNAQDGDDEFAGCGCLRVCESAAEWMEEHKKLASEDTCPEGRVPSYIYLAIREKDNRLIGVIDLRHHINHPILGVWGGHMGYSVRPDERGKGYATEMVRLNLMNCKELNLDRVMITCSDTNRASEKVILANGGIYERTVDVDGDHIKRYWITVK